MAELERIDRFEIVELLGSGGFATVWLAHDPVVDLQVAIKVLADNWSRDLGFRKRFIAEAKVLLETNSPRVIRVHHVGEMADGRPYFVMAWANRGTLAQRIDGRRNAGTRFTVDETCAISAELARAVGDVHDSGRIHRDIKPANILITTVDTKSATPIPGLAPDERLVLADFGLARSVDASGITFVSGSPAYVAPEQARGLDQLDENVDLFPIGMIATELLTGALPAQRSAMLEAAVPTQVNVAEHLQRHNVQIPQRLVDLLQRLLDPNPADRPGSAVEVAQHFASIGAEPVATAGASAPAAASASAAASMSTWPSAEATQLMDDPAAPAINATQDGRRWIIRLAGGVVVAAVAVTAGIVGTVVRDGGDDPSPSTETETSTGASADPSTTVASTDGSTSLSAKPAADNTAFPLPDIAVVTDDDEAGSVAAIAAPIDDVIDFYHGQTHDGWTVEPFADGEDTSVFRMTSETRTAQVTLDPTAQAAGPGIVQIAVQYEGR